MKIYRILFTKYINIVCNFEGNMKIILKAAAGLSDSDGLPLPVFKADAV